MPDPNDPPLIIDPRLGSLMVTAFGHLNAPAPSASGGVPINFGPPAAEGEAGTLGPYRVVRELGRGGMGAVFLAVDTRLDRRLALKVMLPEFAANPEAKERFLREAKAAARIGHDHVVTVFEADERDGLPYIAMQLLHGYPLDAFLAKKGNPSLRHIVRIAREAALGLDAAHRLGVVHRDIKPANLWLESPHGRVKLLDFGLARPDGVDAELTRTGVLIGTPAFMSPEQALGEPVDHRTDLFSLGSVLYWLCTGQLPFQGPSVVAVLKALTIEEPKPVLVLNPKAPLPLAELIHRLLAKAPQGRPQTAAEVANRLHEILEQGAGLSSAAPGGAADPSGSQAGSADPWTTLARSAASQQAGPAPLVTNEPKLLRSMRVVSITPMKPPGESQEKNKENKENEKNEENKETEKNEEIQKPASASRTVISSGVVWEKVEEDEEDRKDKKDKKGKDDEERSERPRRKKQKASRPVISPRAWGDSRGAQLPDWSNRKVNERAEKSSNAPLFIGLSVVAVVLVAVAVTGAVLVVGWRSRIADLAQQEREPSVELPRTRFGEPPASPPVAPKVRVVMPAVPPTTTTGSGGKEPTILGSIQFDPKFKTVGPAGAVLIGLEAQFEPFGGTDIVRAVRPIYRVNGREEFGQQFGTDLSKSVTMKAKDGYAVGGITGKAGWWCNGFSLTYMRVKPDGTLDPRDSYEGEWGGYGGPGDIHKVISDGTPVVGIVGKIVGTKTTALGLLFKGQEGWDPLAIAVPKSGPKEIILGSTTDAAFRDEAPPGGLLVGFDVWYGTFSNYDVIDGIRPIYRTDGRETLGEFHGRDTKRVLRVIAKPDYAVGGLIMKAGLGPDSFIVVFMRVKGDKLDPDDSYQSEKFGGPGGGTHPMLGGDGTPVTGVIGCLDRNTKLIGFGLAFPTKK